MYNACDFSLVIPAFNESGRILPTLQRLVDFLDRWDGSYEITVVDDGSSDETTAVCRAFAAHHPQLQVIGYALNRGKGCAVKTGVLSSRGKVIAFSDADMPVPPEQYRRFIESLKRGNDLVIGSRYLPSARWEMSRGRRMVGWTFRLVVRLIVGSRVGDTQFGFKLFTSAAAKDLFPSLTIDGFAFDAELIRLAQQRGYRIVELPVQGVNAPGSTVRPLHDGLHMLGQLILIRLRSFLRRRADAEVRKYRGPTILRA